MESHPQNPEFKNNPEYFHLCGYIDSYNAVCYIQMGKK